MKKLFTLVCAFMLSGALALAQTGGSTGAQTPAGNDKAPAATTTKKSHKHKGHHKGGKKSKKGSAESSTTPPK